MVAEMALSWSGAGATGNWIRQDQGKRIEPPK